MGCFSFFLLIFIPGYFSLIRQCIIAYRKASEAHFTLKNIFHAGKALENAAQAAKDAKWGKVYRTFTSSFIVCIIYIYIYIYTDGNQELADALVPRIFTPSLLRIFTPSYHGYLPTRTPDIHLLVPRIFIPLYPGYSSLFTPDIHPRIFILLYPRYSSPCTRAFIPSYLGYSPPRTNDIHPLVLRIFTHSYSGYSSPRTPDIHPLVPRIFIPSYPGHSSPRTPDLILFAKLNLDFNTIVSRI